MAIDVILPVLGMAQDSGILVRWLKQPGQTVTRGEVLFEVETDKAVQEIEAPADGILGPWLADEGAVVPVTQVVARLYAPGEAPCDCAMRSPSAVAGDWQAAGAARGGLAPGGAGRSRPQCRSCAGENGRGESPKSRCAGLSGCRRTGAGGQGAGLAQGAAAGRRAQRAVGCHPGQRSRWRRAGGGCPRHGSRQPRQVNP